MSHFNILNNNKYVHEFLNFMININFKSNTIIIILAIELLSTILISVLMIISLLKNWWCALKILAHFSMCCQLKKVEKLWFRLYSSETLDEWKSEN
jgi:hypothetical protein